MPRTGYNQYQYNYNDPSKPNYRPYWWQWSVEHWGQTLDWCGNLKDLDFKNKYLLQVPGELEPQRTARLQATSPEPFFKDSVKDNKSIFTQFELAADAPISLVENQDNIDLAGNDIQRWSSAPLIGLFRDGGSLMGVQPPQGDPRDFDRRPSLTWVPMRDVFWPRYTNINGRKVLTRISIRRGVEGTDTSGNAIALNDYWVYELDEQGRCFVTVWHEDERFAYTTEEPIELPSAADGPLGRLPFTDKLSWLESGDFNLTEEEQLYSPCTDILNLNEEHFNAYSEYTAVRRKTALPTPVREYANGVPANPEPLYIGPGKCINLDAGSKVYFLELNGASLPELREGISRIEQKIAHRDNKLFSTVGGRSVSEVEIENQKAKVGLPGVKSLVESAFQDLFAVWELFANPNPEPVGGIVVSEQALKLPPDPSSVMARVATVERVGIPAAAAINAWTREGYYKSEDFEEPITNGAAPITPDEVIQ